MDALIRYHRMQRRQHAVAAGHRPRRHRDADGGRAAAGRARARRATTSAARRSSSASGSGRRSPAARSRGRCAASAPRSTGRASASPWTTGLSRGGARGLRAPARGRPDLPRQAPGQLGPGAAHRALRPRGRVRTGRRATSGTCATRSPTAAGHVVVATTRPETMLGDTAVAVHPDDERYRAPGRPAACGCRSPTGCIPIIADDVRRSGVRHRLREDHARRTTSTTTRSASATACR